MQHSKCLSKHLMSSKVYFTYNSKLMFTIGKVTETGWSHNISLLEQGIIGGHMLPSGFSYPLNSYTEQFPTLDYFVTYTGLAPLSTISQDHHRDMPTGLPC